MALRPILSAMTHGARLAIDFGTAHTVAVIRRAGREPRPLLFDGSPLMPSGICADSDGRLLTGRDALHAGLATPGAFEPHPKRCIDEGTVLLGEHEIPVTDLLGAVLRRVADEATRTLGEPPEETVLTYPAAWGATRRATLAAAAEAVLPNVRLMPEPVAAAHHFAAVTGALEPGACALVYDFGAGTFDATVVRRTADGYLIAATEGLPDCGGLDVDAAIVGYLGTVAVGRDPAAWARLAAPAQPSDQRYRRQLWDGVRTAKEVLSRASTTYVHLPLLETDEVLGREQLDALIAPLVARTLAACRAALRTADATPAAIYLTGGSSRIPAVATALHQRLEVAPRLIDQPELAVAEGASSGSAEGERVHGAGSPGPAGTAAPAGPRGLTGSEQRAGQPTLTGPAGWWNRRSARSRLTALGAVAGAVAVLAVTGAVWAGAVWAGGGEPDPEVTPNPTSSSPVRAAAGPTPSLSPGLDACLVGGSWNLTRQEVVLEIDGTPVQFSGVGGQQVTYRPDGTVRMVFTDAPLRVTWNGNRWSRYAVGTVTARYQINTAALIYTGVKGTGSWWYMQNGVRRNSGPMNIAPEPERYTCSDDSLTLAASKYTQEFTRVR